MTIVRLNPTQPREINLGVSSFPNTVVVRLKLSTVRIQTTASIPYTSRTESAFQTMRSYFPNPFAIYTIYAELDGRYSSTHTLDTHHLSDHASNTPLGRFIQIQLTFASKFDNSMLAFQLPTQISLPSNAICGQYNLAYGSSGS